MNTLKSAACGTMALVVACGAATGGEIFNTGTPEPGFFGFFGYDVFEGQSVGVAFTVDQDYTLDSVGLWMMNNNFDFAGAPYTVSVQTSGPADVGPEGPSGVVLESWDVQTAAIGWNPILETQTSALNVLLEAGQTYWIVAESDSPALIDAVWVASSQDTPVLNGNTNTANPTPGWYTGYSQGAPGLVINATLVPAPAGALALAGLGIVGTRRRR